MDSFKKGFMFLVFTHFANTARQMDREHSFITIRLRTDKQLLGTNQTLISRKMQEQVKQQNQTGHVCPDNNWYWRHHFFSFVSFATFIESEGHKL